MRLAFLVAALWLGGCTVPNPASCADGACTDPALPFCDVGGEIAGQPNTCIAVSCTPGEVAACREDQAIVCNGSGTNFDVVQCELGCDAGVGCVAACTVDTDCPADEPVCRERECGLCDSSEECALRADTPFCSPNGACVECLAATDCGPSAPVCDAGSCRTCVRDDECDSGACATDGSCVPESAIIYLAHDGGGSVCTRAAPCIDWIHAGARVTEARNHIVMLGGGTYHADVGFGTVNGTPQEVFVHGHGGTLIPNGGEPGAIIATSDFLTIRDLTFSGTGTTTAALSVGRRTVLESVRFFSTSPLLVKAPVIAKDLVISNAQRAEAILLDDIDSELTIDGGSITGGTVGIRSTVAGNKVHLTNLLISGTSGRALELGPAIGELEFSTIADAGAESTAAPCAVACNANLHVTSSIIVQETCGGAVRDAAGACTFATSIVSNRPAPGVTNVDPQFVNRAGGDYHLLGTSPAKDAVDSGPGTDFEGDARPQGARFDIGADETSL